MSLSQKKYQGDTTYPIQCDGLPLVGDEVKFSRPVYVGLYPTQTLVGWEEIEGRVEKSSYGPKRHRHSFTILTETGKKIVRGLTLVKHGVWRKAWSDETERENKRNIARYQSYKASIAFPYESLFA